MKYIEVYTVYDWVLILKNVFDASVEVLKKLFYSKTTDDVQYYSGTIYFISYNYIMYIAQQYSIN